MFVKSTVALPRSFLGPAPRGEKISPARRVTLRPTPQRSIQETVALPRSCSSPSPLARTQPPKALGKFSHGYAAGDPPCTTVAMPRYPLLNLLAIRAAAIASLHGSGHHSQVLSCRHDGRRFHQASWHCHAPTVACRRSTKRFPKQGGVTTTCTPNEVSTGPWHCHAHDEDSRLNSDRNHLTGVLHELSHHARMKISRNDPDTTTLPAPD